MPLSLGKALYKLNLLLLLFKNLGSVRFVEEINTFIQQGCITFTKNDNKDIYNVTKNIYFKYMLNFLFIKES